jgi:hypothetical protein
MDEVTKLLAQVKETLKRKDETYRLIADSKPGKDCPCKGCSTERGFKMIENIFG